MGLFKLVSYRKVGVCNYTKLKRNEANVITPPIIIASIVFFGKQIADPVEINTN